MTVPRLMIVPNALDIAIDKKLEEAYKACPGARQDHASLRNELLSYFYDHGALPDFEIVPTEPETEPKEKGNADGTDN